MTFLDRLETKFGHLAFPGLIRYVVIFNALVYILCTIQPQFLGLLVLDREAVLSGEVWRLVSWIFIPTTSSPLWIFFYLMFTWWVGDMLESTWGAFRLNLYYFLGVIGATISAFVFNLSFGNDLMTFSLLLAIATLAPDLQILLLFFPVKLKWVALFSLVFPWGIYFVRGPLGLQAVIIISLLNYLLFFGPGLIRNLRSQQSTAKRRAKFQEAKRDATMTTLHRCEVCGVTEVSNPNADFRVADDDREYCTKHLPRS